MPFAVCEISLKCNHHRHQNAAITRKDEGKHNLVCSSGACLYYLKDTERDANKMLAASQIQV
jgi:hypothetical protein